MMNKRGVGGYYEQIAADYLVSRRVRILERNFRVRKGEIDIIAKDGEYLVFAEVKYRGGAANGYPEESVGIRKQTVICRIADFYLARYAMSLATPVRFDVVSIQAATDGAIEINWIKNAFPYRPRRQRGR